jgi:hypothetical protein
MKRQTVLRKPLRQYFAYSLRILFELEAQQPIIGIADRERFPSQARLHLFLEPHVQHMVQVDVGQQRADYAIDTKGNFEFEREVRLDRSVSVIDLRRKR